MEGKGFIEKTNRLDQNGELQENDSILYDLFGKKSEAFSREFERLFTLFDGKVSRDNLTEFLDEVGKSRAAVKLERPIRDNRKPKEELEERANKFKAVQEEQRQRQEEFDKQSVEIPAGKIGVCLDVCFDDSDIMTDYFNRHRLVERRLLAIVRKQSETERLALRIIEQVPELKDREFTWHTEKVQHGTRKLSRGHKITRHKKIIRHTTGEKRSTASMRSPSLILAAQYVKYRILSTS